MCCNSVLKCGGFCVFCALRTIGCLNRGFSRIYRIARILVFFICKYLWEMLGFTFRSTQPTFIYVYLFFSAVGLETGPANLAVSSQRSTVGS